MKEKIIALLNRYGKIIVCFCLVISIIGLVFNYLFPNEIISTTAINMKDGGEELIPLDQGTAVTYMLNTQYPMRGIQIGINNQQQNFTNGMVIYEVYKTDTQEIVVNGTFALSTLVTDKTGIQYVYLPFSDKSKCIGDLTVRFTYDGGDQGISPALIANNTLVENTITEVNGQTYQGSLKSNYIYTYNRYPLKLDFKYMVLLFGAVFLTLESGKRVEKHAKK